MALALQEERVTAEAACGVDSDRGYGAHRRKGEKPCTACTTAHTAARRDRKYGMAPGDYARMLADQGGRCFCCGSTPSAGLVVDHDHRTGEVRKLLCGWCNLALGQALESPEILRRLTLYTEGNLKRAPDRFLGDLSKKGLRKGYGPAYKHARKLT